MRLRHPADPGYRLTPAAGVEHGVRADNGARTGGHYDHSHVVAQGFSWRSSGVWSCSSTTRCYTPRSWKSTGVGHSTFEEAVALAGDAGVKRLVLFHHEPEHGDEAIDALVAAARRQARTKGLPAEVGRRRRMTLTL